jgi:hypothetical protein
MCIWEGDHAARAPRRRHIGACWSPVSRGRTCRCRSFDRLAYAFDSAVEGGIADSTKKQIAVALSAASYAISAHVDIPDDIYDFGASPTDDVREAGSVLAETLIEDGEDVDQEQIVRGLSIVGNIGVIADSLDQNSPALKDVITPDEPAKARVLEVSPLEQSLTLWNRITKSIRKYF